MTDDLAPIITVHTFVRIRKNSALCVHAWGSDAAVLLLRGLYPLVRGHPSLSLLCSSLGSRLRKMDVLPVDRKHRRYYSSYYSTVYRYTIIDERCAAVWTSRLQQCCYLLALGQLQCVMFTSGVYTTLEFLSPWDWDFWRQSCRQSSVMMTSECNTDSKLQVAPTWLSFLAAAVHILHFNATTVLAVLFSLTNNNKLTAFIPAH